MKYRLFSRNSGLRVSEIGLGTGFFGSIHKGSKSDAKKVFEAYADAGGRFIDTAEGYQSGKSEEYLGEFIAADRHDFVVASKFAVGKDRTENFLKLGNNRKAMMTAVEESLKRLKSDYIDLYWLHAHDAMTPIEEILRAFDDLIKAGKILYGGLSNFPAWRIAYGAIMASAKNLAPIAAISVEYNLGERSAAREIIPMAEALGIGIGFWSPLGGGFLGRENEKDGTPPKSHLAHWNGLGRPTEHDVLVHEQLWKSASQLGISPVQLAYGWMLQKARKATVGFVPIAGASSPKQIKEIISVAGLTIPEDVLQTLEKISSIKLGEPSDHNTFHQNMTDGGDPYDPPFTVA